MNTTVIVRTSFGAIEFTRPVDVGVQSELSFKIGGDVFNAKYVMFDMNKLTHIYWASVVRTQMEHNRLQSLATSWNTPSQQQQGVQSSLFLSED